MRVARQANQGGTAPNGLKAEAWRKQPKRPKEPNRANSDPRRSEARWARWRLVAVAIPDGSKEPARVRQVLGGLRLLPAF
jgi:hypothetical protein